MMVYSYTYSKVSQLWTNVNRFK